MVLSLKKNNKIDKFCNSVKEKSLRGLQQFLKNNGLLPEASNLSKYSFGSDNVNFPSSSSIKTCIKDGFLVPYIPGTSIKGFVRTAILYDFLKYIKSSDIDEFSKMIDDSIKNSNKKALKADDKIMSDTVFSLSKGDEEKEEESYWDILKAIKVSDAYPDSKETSEVIKGYNVKVFGGHYIPIFGIEGIKEGIEFTFYVENDDFMIDQFIQRLNSPSIHIKSQSVKDYLSKIKTKFEIEELLKICSGFAREIIEYEKTYASPESNNYEKIVEFYNSMSKDLNIIRVGYGSGLFSATIDLLMEPGQIEQVRSAFFRQHMQQNNFPKTRRYIVDDNKDPYFPFGWCSIEEVKNG